ncbi:MAG: hypothetical protein A3B91_02355 [Candidatus Yanofskybacteria bacterium RIFCSPHIGHO2_02_FULL_41_29]|uniref:Uncharacterized protein n=1 Tax=Candidatus Yanofskybacteria bacterium RIFCSPHIGHO2_01_FULL_41_53 TaxID=1802663 RepID=A0A1F8EIK2_9BACT|nr:MAG: hypothetical protein A2650_01780 [Candidatus Yanofskybacteria bacterium RIFCSPHIGHO2_01_FULL_41_53]OGN12366.1 MAG: hypothetical protein A3B91_02355 [Candidatus Yanofskybacteria bacterium RIFCSPHIGHO2_02_FULL_41_29]OGN23232.1 MAG: hypothetical protein A2916_02770 [Candidatus Yanofskybacteria bacterium RIFCSPLOWO2_01_FULL_41_67]OGN28871.1 MAG: hypothetical protein A3H54_01870 [Candidatus Yanofskybacteria bacterium RIFCSPLOWO2_02_FULL_41_13]
MGYTKIMSRFNPKELKSFMDLPDEEKLNFQELGDGGFVRKEVEKNPEVAHRMGIVEDQIINTLKHELEVGGLSQQEALTRYNEAGEKYDYKNQKLYGDILRKFSDVEFLSSGKDYDEATKQAFKKRWDSLGYSDKTQSSFLEGIDKKDLEVVSRLLLDKRFSRKGDLAKLLEDESSIKTIFNYVKDKDINVVALLIEKSRDKDFKIRALREISEIVNSLVSTEKRDAEYHLNSIQASLAEYLILSGNHTDFFNLVEDGLIKAESANSFLHKIDSDHVLYQLVTRTSNPRTVIRIFKFMADPVIFARIIETQGLEFKNLNEGQRSNVLKMAEKYLNALNSEPQIFEADRLKDQNKFVIGVTTDNEGKYYISWSNTGSHGYHKDIFQSLQREFRINIQDDFRSGGYIQLGQEDGGAMAIFDSSSGDFGNYSHKVLERFKPKLREALRNSLGKEVEVKIDISR